MHPLERILRFRRLTEQQARRELERATQRLRTATAACERQSAMVAEQRASLAHSWVQESASSRNQAAVAETAKARDIDNLGTPEGGTRGWLIEEAALEFSGWDHAQLEQVCAAEARRIEPLVQQYIECRRSLRQTERLIEQRAELARLERERRMQMEADEWFLQQNIRRSRREERA